MDLLNQAFVIDLGPTATYEVFFRQKDNSHSTLPVRGTTSGLAPLWVTGQTLCYDFEGNALPVWAQARTATFRPALLGL